MAELALLLALVAVIAASVAQSAAKRVERKLERDLARLTVRVHSLEQAGGLRRETPAAAAVATPAPSVPVAESVPARELVRTAPPSAPFPLERVAPPVERPGPARPQPLAPSAAAAQTLEERLGTRWAVWVGGLALALGGVLLVRYSIEAGVFGPGVRVVMGALFAAALVAAGEWFRRSEVASPVQAIPSAHVPGILTAAGTISAFGTVYAAHALYEFVGPAFAFALLGAIGIATLLAALLHGPALAGLGLAGALVVPLLVSSDSPSAWPVAIYTLIVSSAAHALAWLRRWRWLAFAVVAGAVWWGLGLALILMQDASDRFAPALFAHALVQLALGAVFFALDPHRTVTDEQAQPDWTGAAALGALAGSVVLALAAADLGARWVVAALLAMAVLTSSAWRSAPAAAGAVLAAGIALAGLVLWPQASARSGTAGYLAFGVSSFGALAAAAGLRVRRGRALPLVTSGLYLLAATAGPLLGLVVAYLRVVELERSLGFAGGALLAAALYMLATRRFEEIPAAERTPTAELALGALAASAAAAHALALVMVLERGYLTVAFALAALATAYVAVRRRIPLLRRVVVALGLVVLGRIVWDPRIMGSDLGSVPVFNWLLLGYGVPALAFYVAARLLEERADSALRLCDALGVLFAGLLVFFEIRHVLHGGDPLAPTSGHVEQGLLAFMSLGFAGVLGRLDLARGNPVFRTASMAFAVLSVMVVFWGLVVFENPLFESERVRGPVVLSTLALGYLLPAVAAAALARSSRGVRPGWYVTWASVLALALLFGYVTLEVRHAFQGERLALSAGAGASAAEVSTYSVAWLALGIAFLGYGLWRRSTEARLASLGLVVVSVVKVFLYDLTGIGGFWRAFSVICLGAVLIGIGLVYQRLVFARPRGAKGG